MKTHDESNEKRNRQQGKGVYIGVKKDLSRVRICRRWGAIRLVNKRERCRLVLFKQIMRYAWYLPASHFHIWS